MVNIISDYKDKSGRDFHEANQVLGTEDAVIAGQIVIERLRSQGYIPTALLQVFGDYTIDQLQEMAHQHTSCACRVIYINPAYFAEACRELQRAREAKSWGYR